MNEILLTATEKNISTITSWGMGLLTLFLTYRAIMDFSEAISNPETGLKEAFRKCKKRIVAAVIAITIESTVLWIKSFYI